MNRLWMARLKLTVQDLGTACLALGCLHWELSITDPKLGSKLEAGSGKELVMIRHVRSTVKGESDG